MIRFYQLLTTTCLLLVFLSSLHADTYSLKRNDVITHVNTLNIHRIKDFWKAVKHSESSMYLTVQTAEGVKKVLHVQLPNHKVAPVARFGVDVSANKLAGVKVIHVRRNSPASRCQIATSRK
ncbi:MAG: hypothetical protein CMJ76_09045 [Planctomycetaceae bacterium]|nr:hypothetical protein [Planctomycetaceae bacterium]